MKEKLLEINKLNLMWIAQKLHNSIKFSHLSDFSCSFLVHFLFSVKLTKRKFALHLIMLKITFPENIHPISNLQIWYSCHTYIGFWKDQNRIRSGCCFIASFPFRLSIFSLSRFFHTKSFAWAEEINFTNFVVARLTFKGILVFTP